MRPSSIGGAGLQRALGALDWRPARLHVAERFLDRLLGMTVRRPQTGEGEPLVMAFPRCASVHTCFMGYPLDIAFVDREGRVLRLVEGVGPWRSVRCPGADAVLERATPSRGEAASHGRGSRGGAERPSTNGAVGGGARILTAPPAAREPSGKSGTRRAKGADGTHRPRWRLGVSR